MNPAAPLPGMLRAVRSVQKAHYEALTTGKGCGLSQSEMAKRLEDESGSRALYDALEAVMDFAEPLSAADEAAHLRAKLALAKARGEV